MSTSISRCKPLHPRPPRPRGSTDLRPYLVTPNRPCERGSEPTFLGSKSSIPAGFGFVRCLGHTRAHSLRSAAGIGEKEFRIRIPLRSSGFGFARACGRRPPPPVAARGCVLTCAHAAGSPAARAQRGAPRNAEAREQLILIAKRRDATRCDGAQAGPACDLGSAGDARNPNTPGARRGEAGRGRRTKREESETYSGP